jgi:DNA-directed RNA polymerase subunit beta
MGSRNRRNFGKRGDAIAVPDLTLTQRESYVQFLQLDVPPQKRENIGLEAVFREAFPIEGQDIVLDYKYYELEKPRYTPVGCKELKLTYGYPLRVTFELTNRKRDEVIEQSIFLGDMPIMLGGGTFIVNGAQRVIVSQLHRGPGVDFGIDNKEGDRILHGGRIIPERGSWLEVNVTKKDNLIVKIDQSNKLAATIFMRALTPEFGTTSDILRLFYETEQMPVTKLEPTMWAVAPIVDTQTGEIIVASAQQLGERVGQIQASSISQEKIVPKEFSLKDALNYLLEKMEFKFIPTPGIDRESLELLEDRLMLDFPSNDKNANKPHLPRFNTKNVLKDVSGLDAFRAEWEKKASDGLKQLYQNCLAKVKDDSPWYSDPKQVAKDIGFEEKGVYIYRLKSSGLINDAYIGIAGERKDGGLRGRMCNSHYSKSHKTDSLQKAIKSYFDRSSNKALNTDCDSVEVITKVPDYLILNTLAEDECETYEHALIKIYGKLRPGNPANVEKAQQLFIERFYDDSRYRLGKVGRFRLNRKFGTDISEDLQILRPDDFIEVVKYILALRENKGELDDIDHLGNRRIRTVGELACDEIRKGLLKLRRTVTDRINSKLPEEVTKIGDIVNSKSVANHIDSFFGRGELSQVVDQTNCLSQLTHERRLSALGPGGLNRKRAGFEVRDVHISHYGRICPIETPEGANIGLISSLGVFACLDEYGFLLTPYRKIVDGKISGTIEYLRADREMELVFAPPGAIDPKTQELLKGLVIARDHGELTQIDSSQIEYVDVSPKQTVGISASLIPFLEHDDANRALMGSNMMRQAVPLLQTEAPIVGTGMEDAVAANSSMVVKAEIGGTVTYVDAEKIVIDRRDEYILRKFDKLNERTCLNQTPIVKKGQRVEAGQLIADGGATANGRLALGKNLIVAFVPFDGYNFEDAILINENLVKKDTFTSIHIEEFDIEVRETKLGREEFTRDIPNVGEKMLRNLDAGGIIREGTRVGPGDILVGKVSPKSKTELSPEEKLLHAIFGRAGEDVKNDSLTMPSGHEGVVIGTRHFKRYTAATDADKARLKEDLETLEQESVDKQIHLFRLMMEDVHAKVEGVDFVDNETLQDVGASDNDDIIIEQIERFTLDWLKQPEKKDEVKKVIDMYWPKIVDLQEDLARDIDHKKRGDELPNGVLEKVRIYIATKRPMSVGDKIAGRHGNKGIIARILQQEDMPFLDDGTPVDIVLNPLGVPSRMNVGQILETHLGWAAKVLGFDAITPVFDGADEEEIHTLMSEANKYVSEKAEEYERSKTPLPADATFSTVPDTLKIQLYDGRTGEPFEQRATVGYMYVLKLHHLVDEKIHARATGPYSLITQQPLGGKARTGGQRFGEMEVWALEGYGAAYTLQELITVKSDDIEGRSKIYESMVKGNNTLQAGTPVSFDVLCNEIKGLCLNIRLEKSKKGNSPF